jgi:hypothetical protein
MARLAASAMRFMRSLPMRVYFFLTLLANNLPQTGKRQYQNKGTCAPFRRDGFNQRTNEKKKFALPSFPPKEMPALFPVQRNIETRLKPLEQARYCTRRRPCQGTINLYGRLRICILCNAGLLRPPNYPGARTAHPKNGGGTRHARSSRAKTFDKNKNRE